MEPNYFPSTPSTDLQTNTEVIGFIVDAGVPSVAVPLVTTATKRLVREGVKAYTGNLARYSLSY